MKPQTHLLALAGLIPNISAHYFFPSFIANGNVTKYNEYVREDTQGFMPYKGNYDSPDIRCNVGSQEHAASTGVYKVHAGDEIGFGVDFGALIQHPGPLQVYLSKAPGKVQEYDGSGEWFKIYELGPKSFGSEGIEWGTQDRGNFTFPLPKETPAGQYLVRIEHIALHGAGEFGGAEMYFNCAQIEVESESTAVPGPLVKFPGVYDGYEPGILFYMYRPYLINYTMPGPRVWPNGGGAVIRAEGIDVAPTDAWSAPAVTPSATAVLSSSAAASTAAVSSSAQVSAQVSASPVVNVAVSTPVESVSAETPAPTVCNQETVTVTVQVTETATATATVTL